MLNLLRTFTGGQQIITGTNPRVLMYHMLSPHLPYKRYKDGQKVKNYLRVEPEMFDAQISWLKSQGFRFFKMQDVLRDDLPERAVFLTFDDGFEDNYSQMFPLLKHYDAKATIYLAPEIEGIERLSQDQIREMLASGLVEFGAHTLHHINLDKADEADAQAEIEGSKAAVEAVTGQPCRAFAYPFGRYNDSNVAQVQATGMDSAVTVKKGIGPLSDPFRIKRISVLGSTNALQFHLAMTRGRYRV